MRGIRRAERKRKRCVSRDSREIGTVKVSDIEGKIEWYMGRP